jgi:plastocyanin
MHRLGKTLAATLVAAGLVTAPATTASAALDAKVRVVDNRFRPETVTVPAGSVVGWVNRGVLAHTVTFPDEDVDMVLEAGERARRRFRTPGTYSYVCRFHFGMDGEVVVTA